MRGLRHLDLHRIPSLTDEGIAHLAGLSRIESFFCTSRRITDASMAVFGGWGDSLLQIRLSSERITDAGLRLLQRLKQLEWIYLGDNDGVTEEAVVTLEAALPKVGGA